MLTHIEPNFNFLKKCFNNRTNHENFDLSHFFFLNWTNQTKKKNVLKIIPYFASTSCTHTHTAYGERKKRTCLQASLPYNQAIHNIWGEEKKISKKLMAFTFNNSGTNLSTNSTVWPSTFNSHQVICFHHWINNGLFIQRSDGTQIDHLKWKNRKSKEKVTKKKRKKKRDSYPIFLKNFFAEISLMIHISQAMELRFICSKYSGNATWV